MIVDKLSLASVELQRIGRQLIIFGRPFTLLAPAIGFTCGGVMALGAARMTGMPIAAVPALKLLCGAAAAALVNIYSNAVNQIFDRDIDRINKPTRPLPTGALTLLQAWLTAVFTALAAMIIALEISSRFFFILLIAACFTTMYSVPPFRFKRVCGISNLVIAIPRGCLITVAGWSAVAPVTYRDPWLLGLVMGLYVLGSASTKDFSDLEGDRLYGCETLPVRYGIKQSVFMIAPFLSLPFLLLPLFSALGWLHSAPRFTSIFGLALALWGAYVALLLLKNPERLATEENHVSWKHMYLMMVSFSVGMALAYLV